MPLHVAYLGRIARPLSSLRACPNADVHACVSFVNFPYPTFTHLFPPTHLPTLPPLSSRFEIRHFFGNSILLLQSPLSYFFTSLSMSATTGNYAMNADRVGEMPMHRGVLSNDANVSPAPFNVLTCHDHSDDGIDGIVSGRKIVDNFDGPMVSSTGPPEKPPFRRISYASFPHTSSLATLRLPAPCHC